MTGKDSVSELLSRWRAGDDVAATELYRRYAGALCMLAAHDLGTELQRRVAAEDIVQSVFRTFFHRAGDGRVTVNHSGAFWHLLVRITQNKVRRQGEHHRAGKRDVGAETEPSTGDTPSLSAAVAADPDPADAAALAEEVEILLSKLQDTERRVVDLALQGDAVPDIADEVDRSRSTVRRALKRFREHLASRLGLSINS